jgi:hypothetical protein
MQDSRYKKAPTTYKSSGQIVRFQLDGICVFAKLISITSFTNSFALRMGLNAFWQVDNPSGFFVVLITQLLLQAEDAFVTAKHVVFQFQNSFLAFFVVAGL